MEQVPQRMPADPEEGIAGQPGERIIADVLERIEQRRLSDAGQPCWDDHSRSYTEWDRQR